MFVWFPSGIQTRCGRTLSKTSGVLQSPDFDQDGYYDHNLECDWTIVTEPGLIVLLLTQAESFDIEAGFCKYSAIYYSGRLRCSPTVDSECRYDNVKVSKPFLVMTHNTYSLRRYMWCFIFELSFCIHFVLSKFTFSNKRT